MNERVQFSAATSFFCRLMQLATLGAIGLFAYHSYVTMQSSQTDPMVAAYVTLLTQDQQNLIIESRAKADLLRTLFAGFSITTAFLLVGVFRVFGRFASRPFDLTKAMRTVRFLGLMFILKAVVDFVENPVMAYAWTYDNPAEFRSMNLGINILGISTLTHIALLLIGAGLIIAGNLAVSALQKGTGGAHAWLAEAEEDLAEAEAELDEAHEELAEAQRDLAEAETPEQVAEAIEEIAEAKEEIAEATAEIAEAKADVADAEKAIDAGRPDIEKA